MTSLIANQWSATDYMVRDLTSIDSRGQHNEYLIGGKMFVLVMDDYTRII